MAPARPKTPSDCGRGRPPKTKRGSLKTYTATHKLQQGTPTSADISSLEGDPGATIADSSPTTTITPTTNLTPARCGRGRPPKARVMLSQESEEEALTTSPSSNRTRAVHTPAVRQGLVSQKTKMKAPDPVVAANDLSEGKALYYSGFRHKQEKAGRRRRTRS